MACKSEQSKYLLKHNIGISDLCGAELNVLILQEQSPQIPHLRHKIYIFSTLMKMLSNLAHCALQLFTRYMSRQWPDLHLMFIIIFNAFHITI